MLSLLGHKTGRNFLCDLCGFTSHSMGRLIHHARTHGVARIKPHFYFGTLYGELPKADREDSLRLRRRMKRGSGKHERRTRPDRLISMPFSRPIPGRA